MARPVAFVTGASRGIGKQLALDLAERGYDLVVTARSTEDSPSAMPGTIDQTAAACEARGAAALPLPANVRNEDDVNAVVEQAYERFGRVDVLVNNAGVAPFGSPLEMPTRVFKVVMDVNVNGPFYFMRAVAPRMRDAGGGRIVNISSSAAGHATADRVSYGASKRALESISESLAAELAGTSVAVNALRVEMAVWSEGFAFNLPGEDLSDFEDPAVVSDALFWLLDQPAAYTGQTVSILSLREQGAVRPRSRIGDRA
jgi:citronellol/citronellal dehydrogenase